MAYWVSLDGELFPGLPGSTILLPDHWEVFPGRTEHASKVWGDPTFNLVKYIPLVSITIMECDEFVWEGIPEARDEWSPTVGEEVVSETGIEAVAFQRHLLFADPMGLKHNAILTAVAPSIDPSRVWEIQDIIDGAFMWK